MVASGALAVIDDPRSKRGISEVYSEAVATQQFIEYFTADLGRASDRFGLRLQSVDATPNELRLRTVPRRDNSELRATMS